MIITDTRITYVSEKLKSPFGFKGNYVNELWQVVCKIETSGGLYGTGIGTQCVLWSDSTVYAANSETEANLKMYAVTEFALKLLKGRHFDTPIHMIDYIYPKVSEYAQESAGVGGKIKGTFVRNALVAVDNALWQLYGRINGTENLFRLIPQEYSNAFCVKHNTVCNIPLITYGTSSKDIQNLLTDGAVLLKIKIGSNPANDFDPEKMLDWDKNRILQVHNIAKEYHTDYTYSGNILYYLDANGRYDSLKRVADLLEFAEKTGALKNIVLFEEPFAEDNKINVSSLPVRMAADESVHSVQDLEERIDLGYKAVALKPVAKTLSESIKILERAYAKNITCFCADLTVSPVMVEFNKNIAARIQTLPEMKIGILESNGAQNYINWDKMTSYHPMAGSSFIKANKGLYHLDESFFDSSGGIFRKSDYYDNIK